VEAMVIAVIVIYLEPLHIVMLIIIQLIVEQQVLSLIFSVQTHVVRPLGRIVK
jgi:hypothetical protein